MSDDETRKLYGKLANCAYLNAMDVYKEARLLANNGSPERAFSLGVTCIEELAKSLVSKAIWIGKATPDEMKIATPRGDFKVLTNHQAKQEIIGYYAWLMTIYKEHPKELLNLVNKGIAIDKEYLTSDSAKEIREMFASMKTDREDSLYVGIADKNVVSPKDNFDLKRCKKLFEIIESFLTFYDPYVTLNRDQYRLVHEGKAHVEKGKFVLH